jgi:acetyl esterase
MAVPLRIRLIDTARRRARGGIADMTPARLAEARGPYVPDLPVVGGLLARAAQAITGRPHPGVTTTTTTVPGAVGDLSARLHTPAGARPDAPVVLHLHGGGWMVGGPVQYDWLCTHLAAELGAIVISPDYRKAPEAPAPAAGDDSIAVARWLLRDGGMAQIGGGGPLVAVGDSAGGNLAALVAIAARDEGWEGLVAQLLIYPGTDLTMRSRSATELTHEPLLHREDMEAFVSAYLAGGMAADDPRVSPLHVSDLSGLAPACVTTASEDPLKDEGRAYAGRLSAAGVDVRHTEYVDMPHGFMSLPGVGRSGRQCLAELIAFTRPLLSQR